jgi:hypothetical protein
MDVILTFVAGYADSHTLLSVALTGPQLRAIVHKQLQAAVTFERKERCHAELTDKYTYKHIATVEGYEKVEMHRIKFLDKSLMYSSGCLYIDSPDEHCLVCDTECSEARLHAARARNARDIRAGLLLHCAQSRVMSSDVQKVVVCLVSFRAKHVRVVFEEKLVNSGAVSDAFDQTRRAGLWA